MRKRSSKEGWIKLQFERHKKGKILEEALWFMSKTHTILVFILVHLNGDSVKLFTV